MMTCGCELKKQWHFLGLVDQATRQIKRENYWHPFFYLHILQKKWGKSLQHD